MAIAEALWSLGHIPVTRPTATGPQVVSIAYAQSWVTYLSFAGIALSSLVTFSFGQIVVSGLHSNLLRMFVVVGNAVFYSLVAYLLLRLMAGWKSESTPVGSGNERARAGGNMQRPWPALGIGLGITAVAAALAYIPLTRQIPNGHEVVSMEQIHPYLICLDLPGLVLLWLSILVTGAPLGVHPMAARAVVSAGDIWFYTFAAYAVLQMSANLSAR